MAAVISIEESNPQIIHSIVYKSLQNEVSPEIYEEFIYDNDSTGSYREQLKNNYNAVDENIPYYSIKILYVFLAYLFYKMGFSLTISVLILSLISCFSIFMILFHILTKSLNNVYIAGLITLFIATSSPMMELAKLTTPDALSTLSLLIVAVILINNSKFVYVLIAMVLSIATRPDNIVFCAVLLIIDFVQGKKSISQTRPFFIGLVGVALTYFVIMQLSNNYGWPILFYNTYIERLSLPKSLTPELKLNDYITVILNRLPALVNPMLLFTTLIVIYKSNLLTNIRRKILINSKYVITFFWTTLITILIRFFLFPNSTNTRFIFVYFLVLIVSVLLAGNWQINKSHNQIDKTN